MIKINIPKRAQSEQTEVDIEILEFNYGRPIIIIGANGSGKTRFAYKIEELNDSSFDNENFANNLYIKRIAAQKALNISKEQTVKDYETSSDIILYGRISNRANRRHKDTFKYGNTPSNLINDYDALISFFLAKNAKELSENHQRNRERENRGDDLKIDQIPEEAVKKIWNEILPNREIDFSKSNVNVRANDTEEYHGNEMSDGERVVLYLILSFLTTPPNSLIIIDEPELHIHKAILEVLWDKLEALREDCVVMYITHDLGFALSRNAQKKIWMKKYDGMNKWEYEFIEEESQEMLPKELLFQILGPSQKVIFLEGTKESLDYKLYKEIYGDKYQVIPCGGCSQVINYVKAARTIPLLNSYEIYGIIDRDFRTENEILSLEKDNIYVLKVAEVENLFIVPPLIEFMEKKTGCVAGKAQVAIKEIVQKYQEQKDNQVSEALEKEILHRVKEFGKIAKNDTDEGISNKISEKFTTDIIKTLREEKEAIFNTQDDPEAILKVFNWKPLKGIINNTLGFGKNENSYSSRVLNYLSHDDESQKEIITILKNYCPLIPEEK